MRCAVAALERFVSLQDIQHLVITQLTPKNVPSIKALLKARNTSDGSSQLQITLSNPAKQILKSTMGMSLGCQYATPSLGAWSGPLDLHIA